MTAPRCAWVSIPFRGGGADLDDPVGEMDRRGTVRNHQHETADAELAYRSERALLCRRIEMCSGLVQQEETRSALRAQEATGKRDALTLSRGEVGTVLRDPSARVDAFAGSFRHSCGDFVVGGVGCAEPNVARDCARHQCGPLRHPRNVAKPALVVGFGHRNAVHPDCAGARFEEAEHHAQQRGLAAAAGADQRDDLALAQPERGWRQRADRSVDAPDSDIVHGDELDSRGHRLDAPRRGRIIEDVQDLPRHRHGPRRRRDSSRQGYAVAGRLRGRAAGR